jgi:hypothetical protein
MESFYILSALHCPPEINFLEDNGCAVAEEYETQFDTTITMREHPQNF